jgi:hypothetical protein
MDTIAEVEYLKELRALPQVTQALTNMNRGAARKIAMLA